MRTGVAKGAAVPTELSIPLSQRSYHSFRQPHSSAIAAASPKLTWPWADSVCFWWIHGPIVR